MFFRLEKKGHALQKVRVSMRQAHVTRQNRRRLLTQIRTMWIEGVLEHSLHQAALMALDMQGQPDALSNPWHLESQETNQPPHPLPAGTSIVQVYEEAEGELLILGEPGAGKTTLLLELARTLVERAEADENARLPVVFNLSSWAQKRLPLSDWLVEELRTTYQVPRARGKTWIATNQILPLLDGLDEVAEEARPGCVQAITAYAQRQREQGAAPLVVCCRSQDDAALPTWVNLHRAVSIQPLTQDQIEGYLQSTKGQVAGLRQALHQDPELCELAQRPLMLNILTLAYQGAGAEELPTAGTREAQQQQIFASYVERMLGQRGISRHASGEHMLQWLRRLSTQMQRHQQTVFFLEQLQPDWLADRRRRLLFQLVFGLFLGLGGGLLVGLVSGLVYRLLDGPVIGLVAGLVYGLVAGLLVGLAINQLDELRPNQGIWGSAQIGLGYRLVYGLFGGLVIGLLLGLLSDLFVGLVDGLLLGLLFGLSAKQFNALVARRAAGPRVGLFGGLFGGFSPNQLDKRPRLGPNQGIWRSARNGLVSGLVNGLVSGLFVGLIYGLFGGLGHGLAHGLVIGLAAWLLYGLVAGLLVGLVSGLGDFLQHFALRFWLWRAGYLPWNMVAFLDEAAERLLLRKVGGGYIFMHRLLLDYFVSLEKKEP